MGDNNSIVVSICCITYNHDLYIRDCLDGFVQQKTDFQFEILINDDASTDSTVPIIKEYVTKYPELIKPIFQEENQYSKGKRGINFRFNFPRAKGKYIAMCEGDDYWTDPYKLQKQVDFLEANTDYGLVHTSFMSLSVLTAATNENRFTIEAIFENLIFQNSIATLTVCFRKSLADLYSAEIEPLDKKWLMGDYPFWLWISTKTKIKHIDEITAVYRILTESLSNTQNPVKKQIFELNVSEIREFFALRENKIHLIQYKLSIFYYTTFLFFFDNAYFGKEIKVLKSKLYLYCKPSSFDVIRLWGLNNRFNYYLAKLFILNYKKIKCWLFKLNIIQKL